MQPDWNLKIHAYLHDPPDKPFALGRGEGHEARGRELAAVLATEPVAAGLWREAVKRADQLASGADRTAFLPWQPVVLDEIVHPISGGTVDIGRHGPLSPEDESWARQTVERAIAAIGSLPAESDLRFLALWGLLPGLLRSQGGEHRLGALWDLLPADTRMPNHSVAQHQALVSALTSVLAAGQEPALLSFSLGPVQGFIAQARRTSDLWAGSQLLSRCLLAAVAEVAVSCGPDHVVFPALRRSPAFWSWVTTAESSPWRRRLPAEWLPMGGLRDEAPLPGGLPNRFVAVVPAGEATAIARKCEAAAQAYFGSLVERAAGEAPVNGLEGFAGGAKRQAAGFLQFAWAAVPWPSAARVRPGDESCQRVAAPLGGALPQHVAAAIDRPAGGTGSGEVRPFAPNGGVLYGAAFTAVEALVDAAKRTRPFAPSSEGGLKCTLCGEREVFGGESFEAQKEAWREARERVAETGRLRRGEALCGICWAKRLHGLEEAARVPSTAEVAAAPFKRAVLERLGRDEALHTAVRELVTASERRVGRQWGGAWTLPAVVRARERADEVAGGFLRLDGELLLGYPRSEEDGSELPRESLAKVRRLALRKHRIQPPRPYLAALAFDGDEMGRWLSGAKANPLGEYLRREVATRLREEGYGEIVDRQWPMTPALHGAFSEACAAFGLHAAPRTLHDDGLPAFLVYAGGDDVLALSAIGCAHEGPMLEWATEAALRLRLRFSGSVRLRDDGRGDLVDPTSAAGFVSDPGENLLLALGARVTASAGLAVFHQRWPMGRALLAAREAEAYAKETLGRDALGIAILRRSGQITRTGLGFSGTEAGEVPIRHLQRLAVAFGRGELSPRFVAESARRLADLGGEESAPAAAAEFSQLWLPLVEASVARHTEELAGPDTAGLRDEIVKSVRGLAHEAVRLALAGRVPSSAAHFLSLAEAAAFLGRGGEP